MNSIYLEDLVKYSKIYWYADDTSSSCKGKSLQKSSEISKRMQTQYNVKWPAPPFHTEDAFHNANLLIWLAIMNISLKSCTIKKKLFSPYPYMSPPINKPTKTGYNMSTQATMNNYSYDFHY